MKKRNLKSLALNKKSISTLSYHKIKGAAMRSAGQDYSRCVDCTYTCAGCE
ncbi:hypothetical protein [Kordia sp.]|uniref:hypothetical protein n=1 Tax=Kordia sp. TaxID=1965332 RepID=UPI003B5BCB54